MTFLIRSGAPLREAGLQGGALAVWRDAELLVRLRWDEFLAAGRASRRGAFAAYVAARVKLRSSAIATKYRRCRNSITQAASARSERAPASSPAAAASASSAAT